MAVETATPSYSPSAAPASGKQQAFKDKEKPAEVRNYNIIAGRGRSCHWIAIALV
jgi:hypothetical protein